jgi:hypothetical protein
MSKSTNDGFVSQSTQQRGQHGEEQGAIKNQEATDFMLIDGSVGRPLKPTATEIETQENQELNNYL